MSGHEHVRADVRGMPQVEKAMCSAPNAKGGPELGGLYGSVSSKTMKGQNPARVRIVWLLPLALMAALVSTRAGEDCLSCHSPAGGLANSRGKNITVNVAAVQKSVHKTLQCTDCHAGAAKLPHTAKAASASCLTCHPEVSQDLALGAHSLLGKPESSQTCITCHGDHNVVQPSARGTQLCASCHEAEVKEFAASVHGRAQGRGNDDAPSCTDCHGPTHRAVSASDPNSSVSKAKLPETCGRCHSNPDFVRKYLFAVAKPVEAYESSVHGRAVREGKMNAAACSDCHGVHNILSASDPRSPISKLRVASTCGMCHEQVYAVYKESIHGRAVASGVGEAPTCTDCHGEHNILAPNDPHSPVYVANVAQMTCSRCHEDQRLNARFGLPTGRVASYESSYHGLAAKTGIQTVANCASCHGVHNILPSSDPRSTIAKANLPQTCGRCHPDAGKRFAIGSVHVVATARGGDRVLYYVRLFYLFTIPTIIGLMLLHNLLDWWRKARRRLAEYRSLSTAVRLTLNARLQHALLLTSFILLVVTGFALKFPESFWAAPLVKWEKNFPLRGLIHRIAAVVLMGAAAYHVIYLAVMRDGRQWLRGMLPKVRDVRDAIEAVGYNLGYRRRMPSFPKFNYGEKAEYWALVWGTVVMAITGIVLWAHNFVLKYFSTSWIDVATAIHYYEALLATLAIVVWHFYGVIFDPDVYPLKWTFLTGRAPAQEVREEAVEALAAAGAEEPGCSVAPSAPASEAGNAKKGEAVGLPTSSAGNRDVN
jgi:formate dehydrogenase gamma subunit